ncbi:hypothetical protein CISIN_1g048131mg [Citrus sinensis]|uniref:Basic blue protein n=1 Tax=Citrus sinensis TaxID=2711 RepID=A0A067EI78_CITSI|nr:hypothetical protein CISIN_1g048131mg [Citrus sinensis]
MAQARGSAIIAVVTVLLLLMHCNIGSATTFKVGDDGGWVFGVQNWPEGKTFKCGDILEFNYDPQRHNVIIVDQEGHDSCKPASDAKKFQTGKDQIVLNHGKNFFICGVPTHCSDHGMKLEINVE